MIRRPSTRVGTPVRDGFIRRVIKALARTGYSVSLRLTRARRRWRGEHAFELAGSCQGCAKCCDEPAISVPDAALERRLVFRMFVTWQRIVNGFELSRINTDEGVVYFRCTHLDPATRRCDSYDSRPGMCRDYPRMQLYQPNPELFEGCGYRAIAPNASGLLKVLQEQPMTEEQREKLKDGLRLR